MIPRRVETETINGIKTIKKVIKTLEPQRIILEHMIEEDFMKDASSNSSTPIIKMESVIYNETIIYLSYTDVVAA